MLHTGRVLAFGALLAFPLLVTACGSNPDVVSKANQFATDAGSTTMTTPDSGTNNLNVDSGSNDAASTSDADQGEAGPVCGDSIIEAPETCDDGNSTPGDGCDGNCQTENNWVCATPGEPCTYMPPGAVCGNGVVEPGETCDISATANDGTQGCSATLSKRWRAGHAPAAGGACTLNAYCGGTASFKPRWVSRW